MLGFLYEYDAGQRNDRVRKKMMSMKKWMALLLAAVLCFSLTACSGGESGKNSDVEGSPQENNNGNVSNEYKVGDVISTNCMEVSVLSYDIITNDDIINNPDTQTYDGKQYLYYKEYFSGTDVNTYDDSELSKFFFSPSEDKVYVVIIYSAKNIGQEAISSTLSSDGFSVSGYGSLTLEYSDGYKFENATAFVEDLPVLTDGFIDACVFPVPKQVAENTNEPLKAIISIPDESSDIDNKSEFIVNLR